MPRSALLLGSVLVGVTLMAPMGLVGEIGLASANAAAGYYTRKKVKGRWITGKFPRGSAAGKQSAANTQPAADGQGAAGQAANIPASGGRPNTILVKRGAAAKLSAPRRVRFVERKGVKGKARYAALPKYTPRIALRQIAASTVQAKQEPKAAVTPSTVAVAAPPAAVTGPKTQEKAAKASELASLPADRVMATASIAPAPAVTPDVERMRPALEARARTMALELVPFLIPLPDLAPPVVLAARSVSFDLDKGLRTTVFEDGTTVTVPFDKTKAPELTGLRPASP